MSDEARVVISATGYSLRSSWLLFIPPHVWGSNRHAHHAIRRGNGIPSSFFSLYLPFIFHLFYLLFLFLLVTPRPKEGKGYQCDGAASSLDTTDRRLPFGRAGVSLSAQSLPHLAAGTSRPIRQPRVPCRCSVALRPGVLQRDRPFQNGAQRCIPSTLSGALRRIPLGHVPEASAL